MITIDKIFNNILIDNVKWFVKNETKHFPVDSDLWTKFFEDYECSLFSVACCNKAYNIVKYYLNKFSCKFDGRDKIYAINIAQLKAYDMPLHVVINDTSDFEMFKLLINAGFSPYTKNQDQDNAIDLIKLNFQDDQKTNMLNYIKLHEYLKEDEYELDYENIP